MPSSCLPRDLIRTGDGSVTCEILEVLPVGTTCASQAARGRDAEPVRMEEDREVCRVTQLVPTSDELAAGADPAGLGWFYDDYTAQVAMDCEDPDRRREIRFTSGAESVPGAKFRLECLSPVVPTGDRADIGSSCESGGQADCDLAGDDLDSLQSQYDRENASLICDDFSNTCQLSCAADADCPGGFVCFEADEGNMGTQSYCISPTCQI